MGIDDHGLERDLRANRPQLDSDVDGRIVSRVASASGSRSRGRILLATVLTVGALGGMSALGGLSYAGSVIGGSPTHNTPATDNYGCPTNSEPDHNGDVHSNCHTGSKFRGAGGEDKPGAKG